MRINFLLSDSVFKASQGLWAAFFLYLERGFWSPRAVSGSPLCRDVDHESDCADLGLVTKPGLRGEIPQVKASDGKGKLKITWPL